MFENTTTDSQHLKDPRRNSIITASECYDAIHDRKKLWRVKTNREEKFLGNEMTQWGLDHEHIALSDFEKKMADVCNSGNKLIVHPEYPFGASPDAFLNGVPVEIKCPYKLEIYETIPERYYYQMQLQMFCCQAIACHFVVWTPYEMHTELVQYDKEFIDWYMPYGLEFLKYMQDDEEPPRWNKKPIWQI